jgi:DNA mismatch endonuclease (patch repair protein)
MPDIVDAQTRSRMMRGIRNANTRPELKVRRRLHAEGLRFRLRSKDLPGKPDIVFRKLRTAVFVHGCFWHQHPGCKFATTPDTNALFWQQKLQTNVLRDERQAAELQAAGWIVETVWECAAPADLDDLVARILGRRGKLVMNRGPRAHVDVATS